MTLCHKHFVFKTVVERVEMCQWFSMNKASMYGIFVAITERTTVYASFFYESQSMLMLVYRHETKMSIDIVMSHDQRDVCAPWRPLVAVMAASCLLLCQGATLM